MKKWNELTSEEQESAVEIIRSDLAIRAVLERVDISSEPIVEEAFEKFMSENAHLSMHDRAMLLIENPTLDDGMELIMRLIRANAELLAKEAKYSEGKETIIDIEQRVVIIGGIS